MAKPTKKDLTIKINRASLAIRIGLAVVFAYAAIDAFREPVAWIPFIPMFTTKLVPAQVSLDIISGVQIVLVVWLLTGRFIRYAALLSIALIAGIMAFNISTLLITFRDIGLIAAALALFLLSE